MQKIIAAKPPRNHRGGNFHCLLLCLVVVGAIVLQPNPGHAQAPPFEWVKSAGGFKHDIAYAVAVDTATNIYVTGSFEGTAMFGGISLTAPGSSNAFVARYDSTGSAVWAREVGGASNSVGMAIAVDASGSIYLTGRFRSNAYFGDITLTNAGSDDIFLVKYANNGDVLWARRAGGASIDIGYGVAVDAWGNCHVVGQFASTATFGETNITSAGNIDVFHANYDSAGNLHWVRKAGGTGPDLACGIAADSAGSTFVVGQFRGPADFGVIQLSSNGVADMFVAKYDSTGSLLWVRQAGGGGVERALGVAAGVAGACYLTGYFQDTVAFDGFNLVSAGGNDIFVVKYGPGGNVLWARRAGGTSGFEQGRAIALDSVDNCYVTGEFSGTATFDSSELVYSGGTDIFVAKYNSAGVHLWAKKAGLASIDSGGGIALDPGGNGYVAGTFYGSANFDAIAVTEAGYADSFITKVPAAEPLPPKITTQPRSQTMVAGDTAIFTVVATGVLPLVYQWQFEGAGLAEQTNATLTVTNAQQNNEGIYRVVVSNSGGAVTSLVVTLTVRYSLVTLIDGNGSVIRDLDSTSYSLNCPVTLTAVEGPGSTFLGWSGDAADLLNPVTIMMTENKTVTAHFTSTPLILTTVGAGTVSRVPDEPSYLLGAQVTLTATPGRWHGFTGWGDGPTANPRVITIGTNNHYTAIFSPTTALETLTFDNLARTAPVGMPAVFVDGEFVPAGAVTRQGSAVIDMLTTFPNGFTLFTLDGTEPDFTSLLYGGPFALPRTATIRAKAWDVALTESWEADPVRVVIEPVFGLHAGTAGSGSIVVEPASSAYVSNTVVSLVATPNPGWTFLQWLGDADGSNPTNAIVLTRDRCVQAVFGTPLATAVSGNGTVVRRPAAPFYPYGTMVELTAVPAAGAAFALWANAVSSTNNPLLFPVTNANPALTAVFATLDAGQYALAALAEGQGTVRLNPRANRHKAGASVTLTATPDAGQAFLGWSGDAGGTNNPLLVTVNESRMITARFTKRPRLEVGTCAGQASAEGLPLLLTGEVGAVWRIEASDHLAGWTTLALVTNRWGTVQHTDRTATNSTQRFYRVRIEGQ